MGCNCGSSRRPSGMGTRKPAPAPAPSDGKRASFQLILSSGESFTYGSRLEAEAARIRSGGTGRVVPPKG